MGFSAPRELHGTHTVHQQTTIKTTTQKQKTNNEQHVKTTPPKNNKRQTRRFRISILHSLLHILANSDSGHFLPPNSPTLLASLSLFSPPPFFSVHPLAQLALHLFSQSFRHPHGLTPQFSVPNLFPLFFSASSSSLSHPHIISSHLFPLLLRRPPLIPRSLLLHSTHFPSSYLCLSHFPTLAPTSPPPSAVAPRFLLLAAPASVPTAAPSLA